MSVILATWEAKIRIAVGGQPRQKVRTYLKNTQHTPHTYKTDVMVQAADHLPSSEALSSNPSPAPFHQKRV
jgi:hypothetical protein